MHGWPLQNTVNVNRAAVRLATSGLCSRRHKLPHVCFLAVSVGVLKVRLDTKAPKKFSYIYDAATRDMWDLIDIPPSTKTLRLQAAETGLTRSALTWKLPSLKGSTRWTQSYSCSAAIDDSASIGRHFERSSTVGLVERLILLVVASHMSLHPQRIGVGADDEQWPTSRVLLCRWWRRVVWGPIPVEHRSWQLYIPTDCHHIERTVVYLVDKMWATVELYHPRRTTRWACKVRCRDP